MLRRIGNFIVRASEKLVEITVNMERVTRPSKEALENCYDGNRKVQMSIMWQSINSESLS